MDLLCEPNDPISPLEDRTPYVCIEKWDGGVFRTYAHRKGKTRVLPSSLRYIPDLPPAEQPYLETLYPTPREELQPFLQTWLFFGMLAEMLSLNEVAEGERLIDEATANESIAKLHADLATRDNGIDYLDAAAVLSWGDLFRERLALAPDRKQRMIYLCQCLQYAMALLNGTQENVDHTVRYSINALGELFSTGIYAASTLAQPKVQLPVLGFSWHNNFIRAGGLVEKRMLDQGWCPSEIEKIRSTFQGLNTMHYTSRLRREERQDHSGCSVTACSAFQIDMKMYEPRHASVGCKCGSIEVDAAQVTRILRSTESFPVIRVEFPTADDADMTLFVEEYQPGVSYVALSHVWADGLGNPRKTSLPRCQIAKVARLIADLPPDLEAGPLRMWLDTLCCPIEHDDKMISLERIADVYRKAYHVLVLDTSITAHSYEGSHPAELLIRAFGCSPWMRRLWTLQEGALGRTMQIQFKDKAVSNMTLLTELFIKAREDARHMRIWHDINNEFSQLLGFSPRSGPERMLQWPKAHIHSLQRAIHYRTVSVPSDEPLCVSTLMSLSTKYIAAAPNHAQRMIRMWEQLAEKYEGISARVLFFVDETISEDGWHWAPMSLLASTVADPVIGLDERVLRFAIIDDVATGVPTSLGLKVCVPGGRLFPRPLLPGLSIHPWPEVIHSTEDQVLIRDSGKWFRLIDWYRSRKIASWTIEERRAFDRRESRPLCRAIDTGACAVLFDHQNVLDKGTNACRLVQVEEPSEVEAEALGLPKGALKAKRGRSAILSSLTEAECRMMEKLRDMALTVARDAVTAEYAEVIEKYTPQAHEWQVVEEKVRAKMKQVVAEGWAANPDIRQTIKDTIGQEMDEFVWVLLPRLFSHDTVLERLEEQIWIVD